MSDRYLKVILTVIAIELLWIGLKDTAPSVNAQASPTEVVITGVQVEGQDRGHLPVSVVGSFREVPVRYRKALEPPTVRVVGAVAVEARSPLKVETIRPVKVESDRPLKVENVPYTGSPRPGD